MNNKKTEVIELEAEEIPVEEKLEAEINSALVKANVTDQVIGKLKETYGGMKLASLDDKESYLEIKEARREVRKVGILTENICKKGREDAVKIQRMWLDKQKEILGRIAEVQDPLDAEIKKYDDEEARKEKEEAERKEKVFNDRQAKLYQMGAVYRDGCLELNEISYEVSVLRESDEEVWGDVILPKYRRVYLEIEAEKSRQEELRKAEFERQEKELKELEEKQAELKRQQEEFEKQKAEMQRQKDEMERQKREAELEKQRKIDAENEIKWRGRLSKLENIGWDGQKAFWKRDNTKPVFSFEELINISDDEFNKRAKDHNDLEFEAQKIIEQKRKAQIEKDKQDAIDKALAEQKEKERQAELKKQAELDAANDKTKYEDVVRYLKATPLHEMKSGIYKGKMNVIRDFINDLN